MTKLIVNRFILIGPSSIRKNFSDKLKDEHGLVVIDAGALLRLELVKNTGNSDTIKRCMDAKTHGK